MIKHAMPVIDEKISSSKWLLSEEGRVQCVQLAALLPDVHSKTIYCSEEPKSKETAAEIASVLGCQVIQQQELYEHAQQDVHFMPRGEFVETMMKFFQYPNALIIGQETANELKKRFIGAIKDLLAHTPKQEDVLIVAPGTAITLFVSEFNKIDSFAFWNRLDLPSYVTLNREDFKLDQVVDRVMQK